MAVDPLLAAAVRRVEAEGKGGPIILIVRGKALRGTLIPYREYVERVLRQHDPEISIGLGAESPDDYVHLRDADLLGAGVKKLNTFRVRLDTVVRSWLQM
jgi:hypothetical protein